MPFPGVPLSQEGSLSESALNTQSIKELEHVRAAITPRVLQFNPLWLGLKKLRPRTAAET
jgi:hypothetical protein